jgi:hypothetical protein
VVVWFVAVTLAPVTTAPPGSVTAPLIVPVGTWAFAATAANTHKIPTKTHWQNSFRFINTLLGFPVAIT